MQRLLCSLSGRHGPVVSAGEWRADASPGRLHRPPRTPWGCTTAATSSCCCCRALLGIPLSAGRVRFPGRRPRARARGLGHLPHVPRVRRAAGLVADPHDRAGRAAGGADGQVSARVMAVTCPSTGFGGGATPPSACRVSCWRPPPAWWAARCVGPEAPLDRDRRWTGAAGHPSDQVGRATPPRPPSSRQQGAAAAISAIFGNPLVAAVIFLEILGLGRRRTMLVVLPCLVSSGVGALLFTGLGHWTGLGSAPLPSPTSSPRGSRWPRSRGRCHWRPSSRC